MSTYEDIQQVELDVPGLGTATGLCFDHGSCQYTGIQYGVVPGRFRRAQPSPTPWPENRFNATKIGPYPSQPPRDFYPIPNPKRPWVAEPSPLTSSTECLTLNISVPAPPIDCSGKKYPVMVFFHGGAFVYAAGGAAIYDGRRLAEISQKDLDLPTIIVSVNFRLGVFGFLASREIREYNLEFGEEGVGNYGLWDQVLALRWVQKHISSFGGDPERVTVFGQSAGGVSGNVHIMRNERLFSSVIIQSGLLPLCGILTETQYQVIYDKMLSELSIPENLSPRERLQRFIDTDETAVTNAMMPVCVTPVITLSPCDDGHLIQGPMPTFSSYTSFKPPEWCQRVMIGDVKNECVIWNKAFRAMDGAAFVERIRTFLPSASADKLISLYNIDADISRSDSFYAIEKFTTDALYLAPHWAAVRSFPEAYYYHFDTPAPWQNEWGGLAHHSLDNVYIWSLLLNHLPPHHQELSAFMSACWIRFANGEEPWPSFKESGGAMIFGNGEWMVRTVAEDKARGYEIWEAIERLGLADDFGRLGDEICMKHEELCDPTCKPRRMEVLGFSELGIERMAPTGV